MIAGKHIAHTHTHIESLHTCVRIFICTHTQAHICVIAFKIRTRVQDRTMTDVCALARLLHTLTHFFFACVKIMLMYTHRITPYVLNNNVRFECIDHDQEMITDFFRKTCFFYVVGHSGKHNKIQVYNTSGMFISVVHTSCQIINNFSMLLHCYIRVRCCICAAATHVNKLFQCRSRARVSFANVFCERWLYEFEYFVIITIEHM